MGMNYGVDVWPAAVDVHMHVELHAWLSASYRLPCLEVYSDQIICAHPVAGNAGRRDPYPPVSNPDAVVTRD